MTDKEAGGSLFDVKAREMLRILRQLGAAERSGKGSHIRFTVGTCNTTVPNHKGEELRTGTLNGIEADLEPCLGKDWLKKIIRDGK